MSEGVCGDNRFEIIEAAKKMLIESTNIESSSKEMEALDNILFRMWQMKWLPGCKQTRNCDMPDMDKRFKKFCHSHEILDENERFTCRKCPLWQLRLLGQSCALYWSQLPYENGE